MLFFFFKENLKERKRLTVHRRTQSRIEQISSEGGGGGGEGKRRTKKSPKKKKPCFKNLKKGLDRTTSGKDKIRLKTSNLNLTHLSTVTRGQRGPPNIAPLAESGTTKKKIELKYKSPLVNSVPLVQ